MFGCKGLTVLVKMSFIIRVRVHLERQINTSTTEMQNFKLPISPTVKLSCVMHDNGGSFFLQRQS